MSPLFSRRKHVKLSKTCSQKAFHVNQGIGAAYLQYLAVQFHLLILSVKNHQSQKEYEIKLHWTSDLSIINYLIYVCNLFFSVFDCLGIDVNWWTLEAVGKAVVVCLRKSMQSILIGFDSFCGLSHLQLREINANDCASVSLTGEESQDGQQQSLDVLTPSIISTTANHCVIFSPVLGCI